MDDMLPSQRFRPPHRSSRAERIGRKAALVFLYGYLAAVTVGMAVWGWHLMGH